MNKNPDLIKIELTNGKEIDIVSKAWYAESEYYVTHKSFDKIKKYIKANSIKTPINDKQFDEFVKGGLIKRNIKSNE